MNQDKNSTTKRKVRTISVALLLVLAACTFVSRAVYTSLLPRIETAPVERASLHYSASAMAHITYTDLNILRAEVGFQVLEVLIEQNSRVEVRDQLLRVDMDHVLLEEFELEDQIWVIDHQLAELERMRRAGQIRQRDFNFSAEPLERQKDLLLFRLDLLSNPNIVDGVLLSPYEGSIISIDIEAGQFVALGEELLTLLPPEGQPIVVWYVDEEAAQNFGARTGCTFTYDSAVNVASSPESTVIANAQEKRWDREMDMFRYSFILDSNNRKLDGASGTIRMVDSVGPFNNTVPLSAVHEPDGQAHVFVVQTRKGLFGPELFVRRIDVEVIRTSPRTAALEEEIHLTSGSRVVTSSTVPLLTGDTVWSATWGVSELDIDE